MSSRVEGAVRFACIDIGSNTTRLLVADAPQGSLRELISLREFTCIGGSIDEAGKIPAEKVEETAAVAGAQARAAREAGATVIEAVATAAIRDASNRDELVRAVGARTGVPLRVLSGREEARLSFQGATRTLTEPAADRIAVVDVGGGSTELAIGSPSGVVEWWESLAIGSALVANRHLRSDPPAATEIQAAHAQVAATFARLVAPPATVAVAVGGTATSLHTLLGAELDHDTLEQGVAILSATPVTELAARLGLEPERVRLLPAGILVLQAVSNLLGLPVRIARGGLREGVILELLEGRAPAV